MTAAVKDEVCAVEVTTAPDRMTELAVVTRFTAQLHIRPAQVVLEAAIDRRRLAARLHRQITGLYGYGSEVVAIRDDTDTAGGRYYVRVADHAADLARQTGLIDHHGRPVIGLSARTVGRSITDATALVRGAFLAGGHLADPRRSTATITCPTFEAALAVNGALRRLDIPAAITDSDTATRPVITIRREEAIGELLTRIGAPHTAAAWLDRRAHGERRPVRADGTILTDANAHRARNSAAVTAQRCRRAFEILGDDVPAHLAPYGQLRIAHPQASIEQLGWLADPPATKDTVAGRIRRLLDIADRRARTTEVADTAAAVTPEFLDSLP